MSPIRNRLALLQLVTLALSGGCDGRIYVRDGVTDGDTFYLPEYVYFEEDPVTLSWVTYSISLSACQLMIGGDNPARNSAFHCEHGARVDLLEAWDEHTGDNPPLEDDYLDALRRIEAAGYLDEYVVDVYAKRHWDLPEDLAIEAFKEWRREELRGHRPQRRIVGSWNYAQEPE